MIRSNGIQVLGLSSGVLRACTLYLGEHLGGWTISFYLLVRALWQSLQEDKKRASEKSVTRLNFKGLSLSFDGDGREEYCHTLADQLSMYISQSHVKYSDQESRSLPREYSASFWWQKEEIYCRLMVQS